MKTHTNFLATRTSVVRNISHWILKNLFSTPINILLTVVALWLIYRWTPPILGWMVVNANFAGDNHEVCMQNPEGACWVFIKVRFLAIDARALLRLPS